MHTERRLAPDLPVPPAAGEELAEGLMLLRASTLKVIRLQLAIERQDRRVVLEAMDDLVALDDELQKCLAGIPAPADLAGLQDALAVERSSLDREKLGLAAEVISARSRAVPDSLFPESEPLVNAKQINFIQIAVLFGRIFIFINSSFCKPHEFFVFIDY